MSSMIFAFEKTNPLRWVNVAAGSQSSPSDTESSSRSLASSQASARRASVSGFFLVLEGAPSGLDFPELLELVLRFAVNAHFVDGEEVETRGVGEEGAGGSEGEVDLVITFARLEQGREGKRLEDVVFDSANSVQAPVALGDGLGELAFDRVGGFETGDDCGAERVADFLFFGSLDVDVRGDAVPVCVEAGDVFAFGGAGAGGEFRVALVRCDLIFCRILFFLCRDSRSSSAAGGGNRGVWGSGWGRRVGCKMWQARGMAGVRIYLGWA